MPQLSQCCVEAADKNGLLQLSASKSSKFEMQAYFRDLTRWDLSILCPRNNDPLQDPSLAVPCVGPAYETEEQRASREQKARAASQALPKRELRSEQASQFEMPSSLLACLLWSI